MVVCSKLSYWFDTMSTTTHGKQLIQAFTFHISQFSQIGIRIAFFQTKFVSTIDRKYYFYFIIFERYSFHRTAIIFSTSLCLLFLFRRSASNRGSILEYYAQFNDFIFILSFLYFATASYQFCAVNEQHWEKRDANMIVTEGNRVAAWIKEESYILLFHDAMKKKTRQNKKDEIFSFGIPSWWFRLHKIYLRELSFSTFWIFNRSNFVFLSHTRVSNAK